MRLEYMILIILMGIVTYITRFVFLIYLKNKNLSPFLSRSLNYIPISIFATLIFPDLFISQGKLNLTNPYIGAGCITALSVLICKNTLLSIVLGIIFLLLLRSIK